MAIGLGTILVLAGRILVLDVETIDIANVNDAWRAEGYPRLTKPVS